MSRHGPRHFLSMTVNQRVIFPEYLMNSPETILEICYRRKNYKLLYNYKTVAGETNIVFPSNRKLMSKKTG